MLHLLGAEAECAETFDMVFSRKLSGTRSAPLDNLPSIEIQVL